MRGLRKERTGKVISNKMQKTVVVEITQMTKHPLYEKIYKKRKKIYVHDEKQICKLGDLVRVKETRPLSKLKSWKVVEVVT